MSCCFIKVVKPRHSIQYSSKLFYWLIRITFDYNSFVICVISRREFNCIVLYHYVFFFLQTTCELNICFYKNTFNRICFKIIFFSFRLSRNNKKHYNYLTDEAAVKSSNWMSFWKRTKETGIFSILANKLISFPD